MRTNNVEMCSILNGTSHNYAINALINTVKDSMPYLHDCPYFGKVEMTNITSDSSKFPSIFPSGIYRSRIRFYDDIDSNIMSLTVYTTCKSAIKTSF